MKHLHRLTKMACVVIGACSLNVSALEAATLSIEMLGLQSSQGQAIFVLMDSAASHQGKAPVFARKIVPIHQGVAILTLKNVPNGVYSAVIYHDVNANGELDKYFFGLPKEAYGFSNNARGTIGTPAFEASSFRLGANHSAQQITIK
jgi:uncharacterized protein (DUF2141 family)